MLLDGRNRRDAETGVTKRLVMYVYTDSHWEAQQEQRGLHSVMVLWLGLETVCRPLAGDCVSCTGWRLCVVHWLETVSCTG